MQIEPCEIYGVDIEMRQGQYIALLRCNFGDAGDHTLVIPAQVVKSIEIARDRFHADCMSILEKKRNP